MERYSEQLVEADGTGQRCWLMGRQEDGVYVKYADAQRTLDAERKRVRQGLLDRMELQRELATLQAQLRQGEGERDDYRLMYMSLTGETYDNPLSKARAELTTLRQLVEALPVADAGSVNIVVTGRQKPYCVMPLEVDFGNEENAAAFAALLTYRAILAAQEAWKEDTNGL